MIYIVEGTDMLTSTLAHYTMCYSAHHSSEEVIRKDCYYVV